MFYLSEKSIKLSRYFFQGAIFYPCVNFFKKFLFKKYKAKEKYVVISALYNTEKYLDDFLKSIIKQRLDFKKNITVILVDDGSSDESAKIARKYMSFFPNNIHYIYQENSGQSSARNKALNYLFEKNIKATYISFVDSDDILDRDFFYTVDEFLEKNSSENLALISCNLIFYREKRKILYKDSHSLRFKFKDKICLIDIKNLDEYIQIYASSALFKRDFLRKDLLFEDKLNFSEDAIFTNKFLLLNYDKKAVFLKNAKYYYRKRFDKSSTVDSISLEKKSSFLKNEFSLALLSLAQKNLSFVPLFLQNTILYSVFWFIDENLNKDIKDEKALEILQNLKSLFSLIDTQSILNFKLCNIQFFHKIGFLNLLKNEDFKGKNTVFISDIDEKKNELLLSIFYAKNCDLSLNSHQITDEKIRTISLFNEVFCFEKRLWISLNDRKDLDISINKQKPFLCYKNKHISSLEPILQELKKLKKRREKNAKIWLFADSNLRADDNAEHLYRFLKDRKIQVKIYFILDKKSPDFARLKKENFNLISPLSLYFLYLLFRADKIISSHIDRYFYGAFGKNTLKTKDFIFLQHGISEKDISSWLNERKIDLLLTSAKDEYESFVNNFSAYKLCKKQVKLSGLARHDKLLSLQKEKKYILIMPTWRRNIVGTFSKKLGTRRINTSFTQSEYFRRYNELLNSNELIKLCKAYNYELCFNPHPHIIPYLNEFKIDSGIKVLNGRNLQELFANTAFLITDYSSVAFDIALLEKAMLYYQFDRDDFFNTHLKSGYFSYEKDGFGAVCFDLEQILKELEFSFKNSCVMQEPYLSRARNFFAFKDGINCERIYEELLNLDR